MRSCLPILILLLTGRTAFAQPGAQPTVASDARIDDGYAAQIVAANLAPLVVLSSGEVFERAPVFKLTLGTYLLGGPIVHAAHGNLGRAAKSLGLRAGLPIAGLAVGVLITQVTDPGLMPWNFDGPPSLWWLAGTTAGIVAACWLDARMARPRRVAPTNGIAPSIVASTDRVALGVTGAF